MIEIGGQPILWHIMKGFAAAGIREFVIALGYKAEMIKDFFVNYRYRSASMTVELASSGISFHHEPPDDWTVHLLDTGLDTQTGGRVKRIAEFIGDETFLLTYGDGVSNVDFRELIKFHNDQERLATVTAVRPPGRFGGLHIEDDLVTTFAEKPQIGEGWINGGFFVLDPSIVGRIAGDDTAFESEPLEGLAAEGQLGAFRHDGFWQCMDTLRDCRLLESLWESGRPPWKTWD